MSRGIIWTSTEAEAVTGGRSTQDWYATGVSISLDELQPGDLYIATQDDDLQQVFAKGAAAAVVSARRGDLEGPLPLLQVGSVFEALQDLARAARFKTHATILSVQGRAARKNMYDVLSLGGSVHAGTRHLSQGLAALPEDIDFGLFGSSPAVQPDIAVITNSANSNRDTLFVTMPVSGTVLINSDDPDHISIIARAKAAGIQNILTYGTGAHADARLMESLNANNGVRVRVKILDEDHAFTLPQGGALDLDFVAGLLVLKLTGHSLSQAIKRAQMFEDKAQPTQNNVSLVDPALQQAGFLPQAVFKVTNMIDLGFGRQTAVLENLGNTSRQSLCFPKKDLVIPRQVDKLDLMYTSKTVGAVRNAQDAIRRRYKDAQLENVSPEALVPGDFVVFKDIRKHTTAIFSEALRLIPPLKSMKFKPARMKADHAL